MVIGETIFASEHTILKKKKKKQQREYVTAREMKNVLAL